MPGYRPADAEIKAALRDFFRLVNDDARPFKVGRCADVDFEGLWNREEYSPAHDITRVFVGSAQEAVWLEIGLIRVGWEKYPDRSLNDQLGGGPTSEEEEHCVYVVRFPDKKKYRLRAQVLWLQRLVDESA